MKVVKSLCATGYSGKCVQRIRENMECVEMGSSAGMRAHLQSKLCFGSNHVEFVLAVLLGGVDVT
jgi:hypothetical protein